MGGPSVRTAASDDDGVKPAGIAVQLFHVPHLVDGWSLNSPHLN